MRAVFLEYGRSSKRGMASVELTLQVLDALAAKNNQEYWS
jgi:hypothetical protein